MRHTRDNSSSTLLNIVFFLQQALLVCLPLIDLRIYYAFQSKERDQFCEALRTLAETRWFQSRQNPDCSDHSVVIAAQSVDRERRALILQVNHICCPHADPLSAMSARSGRSKASLQNSGTRFPLLCRTSAMGCSVARGTHLSFCLAGVRRSTAGLLQPCQVPSTLALFSKTKPFRCQMRGV